MRASIVVVSLLVGVVMLGCETRVSLGARCASSAECPVSLTCTVGRCRASCTTAAECGEGRRCLAAADGTRACSTVPDDSCVRVEDCGDPAFSLCVSARCQTTCTSDTQCAGGDCVQGGCVERPEVDATAVGEAVFGPTPPPSTTLVGSFSVIDPDSPADPLVLSHDDEYAGIGVVVEDGSSMGQWTARVVSMDRTMNADGRRDPGVGMRIDVDLAGVQAVRTSRERYFNSFTSAVAAEPQGDGLPTFFWTVRRPAESVDSVGVVAFVSRGNDPRMLATLGGDASSRMLPPPAVLLRGFGPTRDRPAYGLTVVDDELSEIQITGPGIGPTGIALIPLPDRAPPRSAVGTSRALLVQHAAGGVDFVRVRGLDNPLEVASFRLASTSSCAASVVDRDVVAEGQYVVATCDETRVTLTRLRCMTDQAEALLECARTPWQETVEARSPTRVSLETWPRGVVLVTEDDDGVHARPIGDEVSDVERTLRYEAVLPSSYRVDAFTDFELRDWAANTAWRDGAAILVIAGLYVANGDIAQVRVGVVEVTATP